MQHLNIVDYGIILIYFLVLLGIGVYLSRKASGSMEDYFLAGRSMPWWALGISGMTAYLDLAGTSLIISFIFLLGPRGMYIELRGGIGLVLVIMMLWTGKWFRRSHCLTGAEWMAFRFGEGLGGQFARIVSAIATIVGTIGMLAYSIKAVSLFFSMYLPFPPLVCALIVVGVTTVYTMMSGFYGVVYSNFFQGVVILISVIAISAVAWGQVSDGEAFAQLAASVTGNAEWATSLPQWHTPMPAGYEVYHDLMMFAFFYLLKTLFQGAGMGDDPRYFGAKSDRDCGTLTALWAGLMTIRWPLIMAFALLGIYLVKDLFPDQAALVQAAAAVKQHAGVVEKSQWAALLSNVINNTDSYPAVLASELQRLLGGNWRETLNMVSYEGTVNPERIMPAVLLYKVPGGLRGLLLVGLLAAEMSTFSGSVNRSSGYFARDLYQRYFRPRAGNRELITASWGAVILQVVLAFLFTYSISSINDVWGWITMSLTSGLLVPGLLRLYWWRFNGGGFAVGSATGLLAAIVQRALYPTMDERIQFALIATIGLLASIAGTYATQPTERAILERFYRTTRPFGVWGPLKRMLPAAERTLMNAEHRNDLLAVPFACVAQFTMYLVPMLFLIHAYGSMWIALALFLTGLAGVYVFWYRNLPRKRTDGNRTVGQEAP